MSDVISTTVIVQAAYWSCDKMIKNDDNTTENVQPFKLVDVTVQSVEGARAKNKLVFWFERTPNMKKVELAKTKGRLFVDVDRFYSKYQEYRNMTFNKGFATKDDKPAEVPGVGE